MLGQLHLIAHNVMNTAAHSVMNTAACCGCNTAHSTQFYKHSSTLWH